MRARLARHARRLPAIALVGLLVALGCDAVTNVAVGGADFAGAKADAYCDRRFVTDGGKPAAFCQEVVQTLAAAQFSDDCRVKHQASAGPGRCPRPRIIAGCKLHKHNDDDSEVWDWYYDVADLAADAAPDAGDGGGFEARALTVADVSAMCADPGRYEDGAELAFP